MQVKLLRVLEQREFMRVGGSETIRVDIRLIAATNQDLEQMVDDGKFRNDLYYRLKVVTIRIPPLRDREGDVPLLAQAFLDSFCRENNRPLMKFSPEVLRALVKQPWMGNVRELRNVVESLVVLTPGDVIEIGDLPDEYRGTPDSAARVDRSGTEGPPSTDEDEPTTMDEIERQAILRALDKTGGNRTQAAEMLGIGLRTLQRKLKDYRMQGEVDE